MATKIDNYTVRLSLLDEEGKEVAKSDMPYSDLEKVRKTHGVGYGTILEQTLQSMTQQATAGADQDKNLQPRKPGGTDFNR
jgi:hypothetical protein